jgi:hypothetical protein
MQDTETMKTVLNTASKIATRAMPATAVVAVAALSLGAYTGYAHNSARRRHRPSFKVTATPAKDTITAGSTAGYRLFIHRHRFPWGIRFTLSRTLPRGARVHFTVRRTFKSRSTLTVRTRAWTPPGVYHLTLRARHGKLVKRMTLTLTVAGSSPGGGTAPIDIPQFSIAGNATAPLQPGVPEGINLQISNPNTAPIVISSLTASVRSVGAPDATPSLPCTLSDFSMQQYSGPLPLTVPASSTMSLAQLGASSAQWPQVSIINRPTDQDGCQGATVTLAYSAGATLG